MATKKLNILDLKEMKKSGEKIAMVTAYDYTGAILAEQAAIDVILVGDSLGMVVLGYDSTVPVTMEDMLHHVKAVRRGAPKTMLIADLPFMSYEISIEEAIGNSGALIKAGADAVKLEGGAQRAKTVEAIVQAGIPVMGHLGLTPQTAEQLGGFKVQGRKEEDGQRISRDAMIIEQAGAFGLVLECIPASLAADISKKLIGPTIGIGAGAGCDGQVLVFHDLLGLYERFNPKYLKRYASLGQEVKQAIGSYSKDVKDGKFPGKEHSF